MCGPKMDGYRSFRMSQRLSLGLDISLNLASSGCCKNITGAGRCRVSGCTVHARARDGSIGKGCTYLHLLQICHS